MRLAEMQKLCNHSAEAAFMLQTAAASVDWCHKSKVLIASFSGLFLAVLLAVPIEFVTLLLESL